MSAAPVGIIGGTGLGHLPEFAAAERRALSSRFGAPSGEVLLGSLAGRAVAFLARHGVPHRIAPHRVNYRANIDALRQLGVRQILAVNAVGGIAEWAEPGTIAIVDQMIDYTHGRLSSFSDFEGEAVAHIDFTDPCTPGLRKVLLEAAVAIDLPVHDGGVLGVTQGPRLESRAEIVRMQRDGCDLVGMTSLPEAALAREAGIDYATVAVVANWAAGRGPEVITLSEIEATLHQAMQRVVGLLRAALPRLG
jgi:5'-deoxy-5'-methylthioadenosine phosphorylase